MAKITNYEQRSAVRGVDLRPGARGARIEHPLSALAKIDGISDLAVLKETNDSRLAIAEASGIERMQAQEEYRQNEEDAKAYAAKTLAKAHADMRVKLLEMENASTGPATGHAESFNKAFTEYSDGAISNAPSEMARKFLGERLTVLGVQLNDAAVSYEMTSRRANRLNDFEYAIDDVTRTVAIDPKAFRAAVREQEVAIESSTDLPAQTKGKLIETLHAKTAEAYWLGEIARNPRQAAEALKPTNHAEDVDGVVTITSSGTFAWIDGEKRIQLYDRARSEAERASSDDRARLLIKEHDDVAAFMDGKQPRTLLDLGQYVAAFGPEFGPIRHDEYMFTKQIGEDIHSIMSMPPEQQQELLKQREPKPGQGYDNASRRYEALQRAVSSIEEIRQKDPMLFAARANIGEVVQLNPVDPDAFALSVKSRAGVASVMRDKYGAPMAVLTNDEAKAFGQMLDGMPTSQKIAYLKSLSKRLSDDDAYAALMQQIRPDSPVTSVAGRILKSKTAIGIPRWGKDDAVNPEEAASRIIEGEALLNPMKADKKSDGKPRIVMPPENLMRSEWARYVGDAYRGTQAVGAEEVAYQVFRAYYAGESGNRGKVDGVIDTDIARTAAIVASGGVTNIGGRSTLMPWGMSDSDFRGSLADKWSKYQSSIPQYKGTDFDDISWNAVGDGKYVPMAGSSGLRDASGKLIVIDVKQRYMAEDFDIPKIPLFPGLKPTPGHGVRGMLEPGNINLDSRPVVHNKDGTISTIKSVSVNLDGIEILLPTISDDGRKLSVKQAVDLYKKTGKHLGKFNTPGAATEYAKFLHEEQAKKYKDKKK